VPGARSETPFVVLSAVFWAGLLAAARLGRERLSEPTSAVDLVALGLAGAKIGRIVAEDRVTVFLRRPFAGGPAAVQPAGDGMRRAIGELVTCPHFVSVYQLHLVDARVPVEESVGEHELACARATADVVSVKKRYSLVEQRSLPVLERGERDGLAFIAWAPLGKGFLAAGSGTLRRLAARHCATAGQVALALGAALARRLPDPGDGIGLASRGDPHRRWGSCSRTKTSATSPATASSATALVASPGGLEPIREGQGDG
jgi:hypothetical protein